MCKCVSGLVWCGIVWWGCVHCVWVGGQMCKCVSGLVCCGVVWWGCVHCVWVGGQMCKCVSGLVWCGVVWWGCVHCVWVGGQMCKCVSGLVWCGGVVYMVHEAVCGSGWVCSCTHVSKTWALVYFPAKVGYICAVGHMHHLQCSALKVSDCRGHCTQHTQGECHQVITRKLSPGYPLGPANVGDSVQVGAMVLGMTTVASVGSCWSA